MDRKLSRRQALLGAAALPLGATALATQAHAKADMLGASATTFKRFMLGDMEVTTILAGTRTVPNPHDIFGTNASDEDFAQAAASAFIPTDKAQFFFTPTLVNTGSELILFDTGLDGAAMAEALTATGYSPDQVDKVVITHMHGDHVGGLMSGDQPTFPNAVVLIGGVEMNVFAGQGGDLYNAKLKPLLAKVSTLEEGASITSGMTAMMAPGHTPGHMIVHLESNGQRLLITADTANHYIFSLAHPDWEVSFDADKAQAAASRKRVFGMLAADKVPFIGYHMPFPALGYVEAMGEGFRYVPASYQFMMSEG